MFSYKSGLHPLLSKYATLYNGNGGPFRIFPCGTWLTYHNVTGYIKIKRVPLHVIVPMARPIKKRYRLWLPTTCLS